MEVRKVGVLTLAFITMASIIANIFMQQAWLSCAIVLYCIHIALGYNAMEMHTARNIWGVCAILSLIAAVVLFIVS